MVVEFSDGIARKLRAPWRLKVLAAERHYREQPTPETKREYLQKLKKFADLVLRGRLPEE